MNNANIATKVIQVSKISCGSSPNKYDARLAKVEDESAELLAEARQKAKTRANEIVNEAGDEAHRIVARAEREV